VKDSVSKILFSLSETDRDIQALTTRRNEIESQRKGLYGELSMLKGRVVEIEGAYREAESRRVLEEHRLKDEEQKISERRRQLTALGVMKNAKLVEREIDIASRALETMQKGVLEATESASNLLTDLDGLKGKLEKIQNDFEQNTQETEKTLEEINLKLTQQTQEHETLIAQLDERLKNLYKKVNARYPGEAVALAKSGSCRSCYRALPAQLYNQIIAGNRLIQCPGCSRILVYGENGSSEE
jgi:uncharacterized protein